MFEIKHTESSGFWYLIYYAGNGVKQILDKSFSKSYITQKYCEYASGMKTLPR